VPEAPPTLHLRVHGDPAGPIPGLELEFYALSERDKPEWYRSAQFRLQPALREQAAVVMVAPGSYWVEAWAYDPEQYSRAPYTPIGFALELAPGAEIERELTFALGGQLRVDARTAIETRELVQFELFDAQGVKLPVQFSSKDPLKGGKLGFWRLEAWGLAELTRPLPAGTYELRLWNDDLVEQRLAFRIEPGKTTELAVTLVPK
jgi:hypothetical protein